MIQLRELPPVEGPEEAQTKSEKPETSWSSTKPSHALPGIVHAKHEVPWNVGIAWVAPDERGDLHASPAPGVAL
eukprot:4980890-Pyramimonas_sp.AAC.1